MHCKPSAHLGESLDKISLVHGSPSFLSSWHLPPSNTWTKQKRPALHWLFSSHGDPARPVRSEKQKPFNKIKNQNTLTMTVYIYEGKWHVMWLAGIRLNWGQLGQSSVVSLHIFRIYSCISRPFMTKKSTQKIAPDLYTSHTWVIYEYLQRSQGMHMVDTVYGRIRLL